VRALLLLDVLKNHLEGIQVGVDIGNNCKLHVCLFSVFVPRTTKESALSKVLQTEKKGKI
jgi:hypothetical protein